MEAPRLDLFLLFVDPDIRGGPQERIETAVDKLASQLLHFDPVAWSIRRIVALEVDSHDGLDASVRFAYERAERPRTPLH